MKTLKQTSNLLVAVLTVVSLTSCSTLSGQDSTLVNAQKSIKQAKITMAAFVHLEDSFGPQLKKISPQIHVEAERIRANAQQWLTDGWNAVEAYRNNKDKSKLDAALAVLDSAAASAQHYINVAQQNGVTK